MSTRSVVARVGKHEGTFEGRYVHWDGSPSTRGPLLWQIIRKQFKGDLKKALVHLIDEHPAGWSSLEHGNCYCHPRRSKNAEWRRRKPEPAVLFTDKDMADTDAEWVYAFDEESNRLFIRDIRHKEDAGLVELCGRMPTQKQWYEIECGDDFRRCRHYAWVHGLTPKTSNLSTQAWLGNQPLGMHDAIGFVINGKRYAATGSGGSSDFLNSIPSGRRTKLFPRNTWVSTVKARNGHRFDVPIAVIDGGEYKPLPGVQWILPATKNESETVIGGAA